jgi:hypothetical protein
MNRLVTAFVLTGVTFLSAASANAEGWYSYPLTGAVDSAVPFHAVTNSYQRFLTGPGGELYAGSVRSFAINLGSGVSMDLFTMVPNGPVAALPELPRSSLASGVQTNYATGLYLDPALRGPSSVAGRVGFNLGGGLSFNLLGGLSTTADGFYLGQPGGFSNRMFTTAGAGFSMNFGRGGTLSLIGSVSQGFGGYPGAACGFSIVAC